MIYDCGENRFTVRGTSAEVIVEYTPEHKEVSQGQTDDGSRASEATLKNIETGEIKPLKRIFEKQKQKTTNKINKNKQTNKQNPCVCFKGYIV